MKRIQAGGLFLRRELHVLRSSFRDVRWRGKKVRIPIMALTATATHLVRKDIMESLGIKGGDTKIVITTFLRPNLLFSVS